MQRPERHRPWPLFFGLVIAGILVFWLVFSIVHWSGQKAIPDGEHADVEPYVPSGPGLHPVLINTPDGPPALQVGIHPLTGKPITASCTTCHSTRTPNPANATTQDLDQFHIGLTIAHGQGTLTCVSCHNPNDYDTLRAVNGSNIAFSQSVMLCAQCHSKQHTDYTHGAHGGMTGYWDLSKGPRKRNTCIDCHDPHAPAFPLMLPTFKPIDRGLSIHPSVLEGAKEGHHE